MVSCMLFSQLAMHMHLQVPTACCNLMFMVMGVQLVLVFANLSALCCEGCMLYFKAAYWMTLFGHVQPCKSGQFSEMPRNSGMQVKHHTNCKWRRPTASSSLHVSLLQLSPSQHWTITSPDHFLPALVTSKPPKLVSAALNPRVGEQGSCC